LSIPFLYEFLPGVRARRAAYREARERLLSQGARFTGFDSADIEGGIHLKDTEVTDADLTQLKLFSGSVLTLDLSGTQITDRALASVAELKYLSYLDLSRTAITDQGLALLPQSDQKWALLELNLSQTQITDEGLRHLQGRKRMRKLDLSGTDVSDGGLIHLRQMKNLRELSLAATNVTGSGLPHLSTTGLMQLDLSRTPVEDAGLRHLANLAEQRRSGRIGFTLAGTRITQGAVDQWRKEHPYNRIDPRSFPASTADY
jgi:uncharacterized protein YjbI with pentapeptide repeats